MRDRIIGTAGHIDHGKTTLLKALTGIDADRLKEEQRRGITIDIGFAHMQLGDFRVGFVDVPGHEKFVKNMLSGIGGIELVLMVVAADESVMPQTREHFHICRLLGIRQGVIVLTKKNKIESELLELVEEEVREMGSESFLRDAPCVAVDSPSGDGIERLREVLAEELAKAEERGGEQLRRRSFRMPVDRVFTIRGFGTVVTGTPSAGRLSIDEPLRAFPSPQAAKVRGIEIFNEKSDEAKAGQRTALNLSGVEKRDLQRGMTLAPPQALAASHMLDVEVTLLQEAPAPLKQRDPVRFHHGSGELIGRVHLLDVDELAPGHSGLAQLRLDTPVAACAADRFILRRYSPMTTIGGGLVLDPSPRKHRKKNLPERLPRLLELCERMRRDGGPEALQAYAVREAGARGVDVAKLAALTGLTRDAVLNGVRADKSLLVVEQEPPLAVFRPALEEVEEKLLAFLERFHDRDPLASGASREELKKRFLEGASNTYFQLLLDRLSSRGLIREQAGKVGLVGREVELDSQQKEIRREILGEVEKGGWNPPSLDELCQRLNHKEPSIRALFYHLLEQGDLVRLTEDVVLPRERIEELTRKMRDNFTPGEPFSVGEFKDLLGVTRKFAIPYLEYLDRAQVTLRTGDQRVLRKDG